MTLEKNAALGDVFKLSEIYTFRNAGHQDPKLSQAAPFGAAKREKITSTVAAQRFSALQKFDICGSVFMLYSCKAAQ